MDTQQLKVHMQSKKYRHAVAALGITCMILVAFWVGMEVGFTKAAFSYGFGDNYYGAFGPKNIHHGMGFIPNDISGAHGANGKILSINLPMFVVADVANVEKIVRISDETVIKKLRDTISANELTQGDFVVIVGSPGDRTEVGAKFIRVLPPPPAPVQ
jgi:hypothetical protein